MSTIIYYVHCVYVYRLRETVSSPLSPYPSLPFSFLLPSLPPSLPSPSLYSDLLKRVFKRNVGEKPKISPDTITDPLDEIYFQTLVLIFNPPLFIVYLTLFPLYFLSQWRRLVADILVGFFIFLIVTALCITSVFCRSLVHTYVHL